MKTKLSIMLVVKVKRLPSPEGEQLLKYSLLRKHGLK